MTPVVALLLAPPALPCDCPVPEEESTVETTTSPFGGLAVLGPTKVALTAVSIAWADFRAIERHPGNYGTRVTYTVRNPGAPTRTKVGVRAAIMDYMRPRRPALSLDGLAPPDVHLNGQRFDCRLEAGAERPFGPGDFDSSGAEAWCAGALEIPTGESVHVLEYRASTESRGHYWETLHHAFEAEATWPGPTDTMEAALDLNTASGMPIVVAPPSFTFRDAAVRWSVARPAFASLPPLYVGLDTLNKPAKRPHLANRGYAFAASSALVAKSGRRYGPELAMDGDGGTAWCEGVSGPGLGQWFEVRPQLDPAVAPRCTLWGFEVIPGYARDTKRWLGNNRVDRFRISSCSHPEDFVEIDVDALLAVSPLGRMRLAEDPSYQTAYGQLTMLELEDDALAIPGSEKRRLERERECFRFTILRVKPGREDDTCIGEFTPLLDCDERATALPIRPVP